MSPRRPLNATPRAELETVARPRGEPADEFALPRTLATVHGRLEKLASERVAIDDEGPGGVSVAALDCNDVTVAG